MKWLNKTVRNKMIAGITVVGLSAGGWYWYTSAAQSSQGEVVQPIAVSRGNLEEVVTSQGKLEAKQYVDVGTQVSGQLKAIHVDIGDTVTKGQLLAEIDPRVYQAQVEAGEAKLNSLRAQLNQQKAEAVLAEQNLKRNQNLIAVNAVSQQALQETESQFAVAKAQVDSIAAQMQETESNLKASRANLSYTKIYAPMAGTVTTLPTKEGQTLNANQTAPTVLQIASLDIMTVRAQVAEADVSRIKAKYAGLFHHPRQQRAALAGHRAADAADATDRQRRGALRCLDRRKERRPPPYDQHDDPGILSSLGKAENALIVPAEVLTRRAAREDNDKGKAYRDRSDHGNGPRTARHSRRLAKPHPGGSRRRTQRRRKDRSESSRRRANRTASQASNPQRGAGNAPRLNRGPQL